MSRLFSGPRGIFLQKRISASPNCAVLSSRSNACLWSPSPDSFNSHGAERRAGYFVEAASFEAWLLELLWCLDLGCWFFTVVSPFIIRLVFLRDVVQAFGDFLSFFTRGVRGELDDAVGDEAVEL